MIPFSRITIKKVIYNLALIEAWSIQSKYRQFIFQVQVGNSNFTYAAANQEATEHITHIRLFECLFAELGWVGLRGTPHSVLNRIFTGQREHKYYLMTTPLILNVVIVSIKHLLLCTTVNKAVELSSML